MCSRLSASVYSPARCSAGETVSLFESACCLAHPGQAVLGMGVDAARGCYLGKRWLFPTGCADDALTQCCCCQFADRCFPALPHRCNPAARTVLSDHTASSCLAAMDVDASRRFFRTFCHFLSGHAAGSWYRPAHTRSAFFSGCPAEAGPDICIAVFCQRGPGGWADRCGWQRFYLARVAWLRRRTAAAL